ncbi:hypothetical protein CW701_02300 [Candidatus Bathyarchaeota archaeon]|nr:MAG: hypothetical protein CW701_02300 [Candidatus Bathyarchaeota archaeon]RLI19501.1 MAG: hypothetical protein DRO49_00355 [Candidatus Bathyarchaeota archaeon]
MGGERERPLPLRTLHDFLLEIEREWDRFRTGSLLSLLTTGILITLFIPRLLREAPLWRLFTLILLVALLYNAYLAYRQHSFYRRWERRLGLLIHLEEELLGD